MKYRLNYCYLFLPCPLEIFTVDNEEITDLSMSVRFKVFRDGEEILFEKNTVEDIPFDFGDFQQDLSSIIKVIFDKETMFTFLPTPTIALARSLGYIVEYEPFEYFKGIPIGNGYGSSDSVPISREEFERIFKGNIDLFDNTNNYSAQSISYGWEIVEI